MVDFNSIASYEPRWAGVKELNLANQWRARWVHEQELPANAPVNYAYALLLMGDKGYAVREAGGNRWGMVEGPTSGVKAEAFVKKAVKDRAGATADKIELIGFLECKATSHNDEFEAGEMTVRPLYVVSAKSVADSAANSGYERRRFPQNEYAVAMRSRYPELLDYLAIAFGRYAVMQAKG